MEINSAYWGARAREYRALAKDCPAAEVRQIWSYLAVRCLELATTPANEAMPPDMRRDETAAHWRAREDTYRLKAAREASPEVRAAWAALASCCNKIAHDLEDASRS